MAITRSNIFAYGTTVSSNPATTNSFTSVVGNWYFLWTDESLGAPTGGGISWTSMSGGYYGLCSTATTGSLSWSNPYGTQTFYVILDTWSGLAATSPIVQTKSATVQVDNSGNNFPDTVTLNTVLRSGSALYGFASTQNTNVGYGSMTNLTFGNNANDSSTGYNYFTGYNAAPSSNSATCTFYHSTTETSNATFTLIELASATGGPPVIPAGLMMMGMGI